MTQADQKATLLAQFMRRHKILPVELMRASGCARVTILRARFGRADIRRRQVAAILGGIRRIVTTHHVAITDLFDFEDGPLPAAREDWHRIKQPGRPPRKRARK